MRIIIHFLIFIIFILIGFSCKTSQPPASNTISSSDTVNIIEYKSDSINVMSDSVNMGWEEDVLEFQYKSSRARLFNLRHTRLEVSFDIEHQILNGMATLELEPWFYARNRLQLDAVGFLVYHVWEVTDEGDTELQFVYDGEVLDIELGRMLSRDQSINVKIEYTARPDEVMTKFGDAIKSNQGLYFIDPEEKDPNKPTQIWTQGETQSSSHWFPTIDAPNQRCTQEVYITVDNKYVTLSNGVLVYSRDNLDGSRMDYWKMDKPHAPYLFMLAVGKYAIVKDKWRDIEVNYYVETEYEQYARDIFGRTPEMIEFFSNILDFPYPWQKYHQIVVRDFVTGAMENTTATVFMEDVQVTKRELVDENWDDIIAHELFHQWFGDLVTCESWANIVLNEGFATYAEYLWKNYKYGEDEAAEHLKDQLDEYLIEAEVKKMNLIRYRYDHPDDLFDRHSYEKGGLLLHLLRTYIGDDAFFKSLNYYLNQHQYNSVEVHDLRIAFEKVTGQDLNWFFDQWFLAAGHPELNIKTVFDDSVSQLRLQVKQTQDTLQFPVYRLPVKVDIWERGNLTTHQIVVDQSNQHFSFNCDTVPDLVLFDSDFALVGEVEHQKSPEEWYYQYIYYEEEARPRMNAIEYFGDYPGDSIGFIILKKAMQDSYWSNRFNALWAIDEWSDSIKVLVRDQVEILTADPYPYVRAQALAILSEEDSGSYTKIFGRALNDSSITVIGVALDGYLHSGALDVQQVAERFMNETNFYVVVALANYFIEQENKNHLDWFSRELDMLKPGDQWYFVSYYAWYLTDIPENEAAEGLKKLLHLAQGSPEGYVRGAAYKALEVLEDMEGVPGMLLKIRQEEKDPDVLDYYMTE